MSKCENCICNPVCDHNKYGFENCNNFKDKSLVIVPPVKVGQTVYVTDYKPNEITECEITSMTIDDEGLGAFTYEKKGELISIDTLVCELGETVFLTREEAERALAERRADNG